MEQKQCKYVARQPDEHGIVHYSAEENETWGLLAHRQNKILPGRACQAFIDGLTTLGFNEDRIPQCHEVNEALADITGWGVERVEAIIPADQFFTLLSKKRFPAATFIRRKDEMDYLEEPDIFHELYGHCPLFSNQAFGDFVQEYAKIALKVSGKERMRLFRLFWFTVEFGLIRNEEGLRIYGGGILSSFEETQYCVDPQSTIIYKDLDALDALRTPYKINELQPQYFVIHAFEDLYNILDQDLVGLVKQSFQLGDYPFPDPSNERISC